MDVIKKARRGVLFIDEVYRLVSASGKDYGREAVETLMSKMIGGVDKTPAMIFAGYEKEMKEFVSSNPGLNRRNKHSLTFKDFSVSELVEITKKKMLSDGKRFPLNVEESFSECFKSISSLISTYNAALCVDLIHYIQTAQEGRLSLNCKGSELNKFTEDDIKQGISNCTSEHEHKELTKDTSTSTSNPEIVDQATQTDFEVFLAEVIMNIPLFNEA